MPHSIQIPKNRTEKIVTTGYLATGSKYGMIRTSPLGSCVAVIAYDKTSKTGGIAHVMLSGNPPTENKADENKYAENAIINLINELKRLGASKTNLQICLVGGANVLKKENDTIAKNVVSSVLEILEQQCLEIKKNL